MMGTDKNDRQGAIWLRGGVFIVAIKSIDKISYFEQEIYFLIEKMPLDRAVINLCWLIGQSQ